MPFENALKSITQLVNDFKANENHYLNPSYSEADVRNDFINKFFIALGWDGQLILNLLFRGRNKRELFYQYLVDGFVDLR